MRSLPLGRVWWCMSGSGVSGLGSSRRGSGSLSRLGRMGWCVNRIRREGLCYVADRMGTYHVNHVLPHARGETLDSHGRARLGRTM